MSSNNTIYHNIFIYLEGCTLTAASDSAVAPVDDARALRRADTGGEGRGDGGPNVVSLHGF